jgi:hypothetical protein
MAVVQTLYFQSYFFFLEDSLEKLKFVIVTLSTKNYNPDITYV